MDEMKRSYLDYAMSVIVSRALPDVRDGLKPVHRRILFSMYEQNFTPDRPYNKCARTTGDTTGRFHPHGDIAVYDAMVRMAQDFSMRAPLIDGQGNFGSVDGDPPAASRYTEARLEKITMTMLDDLDKDTVDYRPNYDEKGAGADGSAGPVPQPARQRRRRHRSRHGDQHPAAQSRREHRRGARDDGQAGHVGRGADGASFPVPISRPAASSSAAPAFAPPTRPGAARSSCAPRSKTEALRKDREALIVTRDPLSGQQIDTDRADRRTRAREEGRRHLGPCATRATATACASSSSSEARRGRRCRAQPALALHRDAVELRRQHDRAERRQAGDADAAPTCCARSSISARTVVIARTKYLLNKARDTAHIQVGLAIAVANIDEVIRLIRTSPDQGSRARLR